MTLKMCNLADRDPALGQFTGPELQLKVRRGDISGTVPVALMPGLSGVISGKSALICARNWNPVLTNPYGSVLLDYTPSAVGLASPGFPLYSDPFWNGMGYSQNELKVYSAVEGGKGGIIQENDSLLTILGTDDANRISIKWYTQNYGNSYGNAPNILSQAVLKDASGAYILPNNKLWMRFVDIIGGDDGIRGYWTWVFERDVRYIGCANGSGQTHARYIDAKGLVSIDCETRDTKSGHDYKTRIYGFAAIYRPKLPLNLSALGESYRWDMNGGDNVLIGGFCQDGPGDSNANTMFRLSTISGEPWGPHSFTSLGFRADANLPGTQGKFFRLDDAAQQFAPSKSNPDWFMGDSAWQNGGWKTSPQITNADGTLVWMPVTVVEDGNDRLYAPFRNPAYTYGASCDAQGNSILPANHAITQIKGANRVVDRTSAAAQTDGTRIDLTKLAHLGPLAPIIAAGIDPDYWTPAIMDQAVAIAVARRTAWKYPVANAPTPLPTPSPQPIPPVVPPYDEDNDPMLKQQLADTQAQLVTVTAERDAALKDAAEEKAAADLANLMCDKLVADRDALASNLTAASDAKKAAEDALAARLAKNEAFKTELAEL
jgi:hypothetical protein